MREGTQGSKGMEQSRTGTPVPGTAVGSSPGSTSRQRRLLSRRVLGGSSPSIPGQLGQEETGLGSADEVSDIHGSLSLHEVPDEMGREDSSRRQPGAENMRQQVGSSSSSSLRGLLGWRGWGIMAWHPTEVPGYLSAARHSITQCLGLEGTCKGH